MRKKHSKKTSRADLEAEFVESGAPASTASARDLAEGDVPEESPGLVARLRKKIRSGKKRLRKALKSGTKRLRKVLKSGKKRVSRSLKSGKKGLRKVFRAGK
jgi:hypothetical protein